MNEAPTMSIQKMGLRNGIVSGILSIIFTLVLYIIGGELMFKSSMQLVGYGILIGIMIFTVQTYRKAHGNYVSFRTAFGGAFSVSIIGMLLPFIFGYILYTFIDPDLTMRLKDYTVKTSIEMMQWFNMPEDQIDAALDAIKEQDYSPTLANYAKGYVSALVIAALFAVVVAFVFWLISRKNEPAPQFDPSIIDQP